MNTSNPPELPADKPQSRWYYADERNQAKGPLFFDQLEKFAAAGIVDSATYIFEEGAREWLPFSEAKAARNIRGTTSLPAQPEPQPQAASSESQPLLLRQETTLERKFSETSKFVTEVIRECKSLIRNNTLSKDVKLGVEIGFGLFFLIGMGAMSRRLNVFSNHHERSTLTDLAPSPKIGDHCELKSKSWLFADEGAFLELQKAKDTQMFALLEKDARAVPMRFPGGEVWVTATNGFQNFVQVRVLCDGMLKLFWTSPDNLGPWPTPMKFFVGNTVEVAQHASVYSSPDVIRSLRKAEATNDEEMTKSLWAQMQGNRSRLKHAERSVIMTVGEDDYYEIEGAYNGSSFRHWVYGAYLTPYLTAEEKESKRQWEESTRTEAQLGVVKTHIESAMKSTFGDTFKNVLVSAQTGGTYFVDVEFENKGGRKHAIETMMKEAYAALYTSSEFHVGGATIAAYVPMTDKFGNETLEIAYKTKLNAEIAAKVHWEKRYGLTFDGIWETLLLHPGLE